MNRTDREASAVAERVDRAPMQADMSLHGVRYQVKDVARAVGFYTRHLGFELRHQQLPAFANVSLGDFSLLLSGPGASGSTQRGRITSGSRRRGQRSSWAIRA